MKAAFGYWPWRAQAGSTRSDPLSGSGSTKSDSIQTHTRNENLDKKDSVASHGNQQHLRKSTFIRLNSVGEAANHYDNRQQVQKRPIGKSGLCSSLSADSISSRKTVPQTRPFFSMASPAVKSMSPRPYRDTTYHLYAAHFMTRPSLVSPGKNKMWMSYPNSPSSRCPVLKMKDFDNIAAAFTNPDRSHSSSNSIPASKVNCFSERRGSPIARENAKSEYKAEEPGTANFDITCKTCSSIPEVLMCAKPVASEEAKHLNHSTMSSQSTQQPTCAIPAQSSQYSVSGEREDFPCENSREDIPCVNSIARSMETPVASKHTCDMDEYESESLASPLPTLPTVIARDCNNTKTGCEIGSCASNMTSVRNTSSMASSSHEGALQPLCGDILGSKVRKTDSGHGNIKKETRSGIEVNSNCQLGHIADLSSVLYSPRKTVKKGRPSSKKQKKRQRQKHKQVSQASHVDESLNPSSLLERKRVESDSVDVDCSDTSDIVFKSSDDSILGGNIMCGTNHKESTPIKSQSRHPAIACILYAEDSDLEESDDSYDDDGSSDWSSEDCEETQNISSRLGGDFNVALNLDSIFKQRNIPTLASVLKGEENESDPEPSTDSSARTASGLRLTVSVSLSEDSSQDSVRFDLSPFSPSTSSNLFGFNTGLCIESLLTKKPLHTQTTAESTEPAIDHIDDHDRMLSDSSAIADHEKLKDVNAKWDSIYPTAGCRSCVAVSDAAISGPNIKVQFAEEPMLITVYEVGTEERGGTWKLDRERFEKRIQDVGKIISPVLEKAHRTKILQQNQRLNKNM